MIRWSTDYGRTILCPLCGRASGDEHASTHSDLCIQFRLLSARVDVLSDMVARQEQAMPTDRPMQLSEPLRFAGFDSEEFAPEEPSVDDSCDCRACRDAISGEMAGEH